LYDDAKVNTLITALLLAALSAGDTGGRLFVHIAPGFEVIVDGTSTGLSSREQGGKIVDLVPGPHHFVVRSSDGREGSFDVNIEAGQTKDITLSSLGLRKKLNTSADDESSSLRIACVPEDCLIDFRGVRKEKHGSDELAIDLIPAGQYPLSVSRGTTTLRANVDVLKGMIITVEANFTSGAIRIVDNRRRTRRLNVAEANDALTALAVPPQWKGAIRNALPAGIYIANASVVGDGVKVTMRVPSEDVAVSLVRGIHRSTAFSNVSVPAAPHRDGNSWVIDFIFYFPSGH
jgi:hypothetical protein